MGTGENGLDLGLAVSLVQVVNVPLHEHVTPPPHQTVARLVSSLEVQPHEPSLRARAKCVTPTPLVLAVSGLLFKLSIFSKAMFPSQSFLAK